MKSPDGSGDDGARGTRTLTLTTGPVQWFDDELDAGRRSRFVVVVFCGRETEVVPLACAQPVVVGRRAPSEILLESSAVSRQHARFTVRDDGVLVEDLDSHNGTLVNGRRIRKQQLRPGDEIQIGPARLVLASARPRPASPEGSGIIIVNSAMKALYALAERVAAHATPTLILGETGTGKEPLARTLHAAGPRRGKPFVAVNCAAIPQGLTESVLFGHERGAFTGAAARSIGLFEQASGGVLFLDEIGELPLTMQAALLRVLETGRIRRVGGTRDEPVDVRLVTATHCDLERMIADGSFRRDFYYRINTVVLQVPPLRERRDEIEPLARKFLNDARQEWGVGPDRIEPEALALLDEYAWPGNVRELRHVMQRAALLAHGDAIRTEDLSDLTSRSASAGFSATPASIPPLREEVDRYEAELIQRALKQTAGNCRAAAKLLRIPVRTLFRKLKDHRGEGESPPPDA